MLYLPLVFLATSLLVQKAFAIPVPVFTPGQVVFVAPHNTIGQHHQSQGAYIPHPHIVLGPEQGTGNVVLAPVTHGKDERNGPSMQDANKLHPDLKGNVLLHHVTANPANIPDHPAYNGDRVYPGALAKIDNAKIDAAKDVHLDAKNAHNDAANAHDSAAKAHDRTAATYKGFTDSKALVKDHHNQAKDHRNQAEDHRNAAAGHRQDAKDANKPITYPQYKKVLDSKNAASQSIRQAEASKDHAKAAGEHLKAVDSLNKAAGQANKHEAQNLQHKAAQHIQEAQKHAPSSPVKPDADKSRKAAKKDIKKADKSTEASKKARH
ncbi:hypothetical protein GALMADRAFT_160870 [Galerina marginata CBS 339.88]|uniref:Uncharacterized protein n=1 Tax=Galerina marginata (strain CBS 339.88) TaxID=685588 RepID=A0A067SP10_GALM3|nr:hypothetical protein GALMADRAFT_160870 [Galerina marginata CBS 339.88]